MPLVEHLRELRNRLVKSLLAILVVTAVAMFFYNDIAKFLIAPACDLDVTGVGNGECQAVTQTGVLNPFSLMLKVSLATGVVVASPIWLYQLWAFLAPGLHRHEKKYSLAFVATGVPLFAAGAWFSYLILPNALDVMLNFTPGDVSNNVPLDDLLDFIVRLVLVFGFACELPLVFVMLNFVGIVSARQMISWWRWVVMGIFVFGAVATPTTDPLTMTLLSVPVTVLYLLAIAIAWVNDRRRGRRRARDLGGADLPDDEASELDHRPESVTAGGTEQVTSVDDIP
jgi:sec-independent protein translocase protein TatC